MNPPAPPQPSDDEFELERDMEYFVEPEEALSPRTGEARESGFASVKDLHQTAKHGGGRSRPSRHSDSG